jgi:predicted ATP-grasp superfamily ATP-dependent carboligase
VSTADRPPAIVAGGAANAVFIGRSLGALGVRVYGLGVHEAAAASRFVCRLPVPEHGEPEDRWAEFLLGPGGERLRGAVLVAGSDVGITVIARHRPALLERFRLDISEVDVQLSLLDKLSTYRHATAADVPTPRYWCVQDAADLERRRDEYGYPVIVKPLLSHQYQAKLPAWGKFRVAHDWDELRAVYREVTDAGLAVMITEQIPGPDTLLCSYNTYLDESGSPMFDFTKRTLRRFPPGMGLGSHHLSDWNPEVKEVALRLFKHVGLVGMANAEFKRDTRDGRLKLIECNARFTDAAALWGAAGFDMARYVYLAALGEAPELPASYRPGQRMVYPFNDLRSLRILRARGELTLGGWLRDMAHPQIWPFFRWDDPGPALVKARSRVGPFVRARLNRAVRTGRWGRAAPAGSGRPGR